jgi:hypothetical protein
MNTTPPNKWKFKRMLVAIVVFTLSVAYVTSYWHFTRQWLDADSILGTESVLYTSNDGDLTLNDWMRHSVLSILYAPLNWLDHQVLGTPHPPRCVLFDLS